MNKYDELVESERDYESEDYAWQQLERENLETREKQEKLCWDMKRKRYYTDFP